MDSDMSLPTSLSLRRLYKLYPCHRKSSHRTPVGTLWTDVSIIKRSPVQSYIVGVSSFKYSPVYKQGRILT